MPDSYRLVLNVLGSMVVQVDVDGELFSLRGGSRLEVSDGTADLARTRITSSRAAILSLLDAGVGLDEAVQAGAVDVQGAWTTSCELTTLCSRTSTEQFGHRRIQNCHCARGAAKRERVSTTASSGRRPMVAVLGAGIAGLTAAHELVERGFDVTVYEPRPDERAVLDKDMPPGCYPPVKLGGLAASQYSRGWVRATATPASCAPSRVGGVGRRFPATDRSQASTAFVSFPRTTCASGTCSSAFRCISD